MNDVGAQEFLAYACANAEEALLCLYHRSNMSELITLYCDRIPANVNHDLSSRIARLQKSSQHAGRITEGILYLIRYEDPSEDDPEGVRYVPLRGRDYVSPLALIPPPDHMKEEFLWKSGSNKKEQISSQEAVDIFYRKKIEECLNSFFNHIAILERDIVTFESIYCRNDLTTRAKLFELMREEVSSLLRKHKSLQGCNAPRFLQKDCQTKISEKLEILKRIKNWRIC